MQSVANMLDNITTKKTHILDSAGRGVSERVVFSLTLSPSAATSRRTQTTIQRTLDSICFWHRDSPVYKRIATWRV
jgi:hypothetical protein